MKMMKMHANDDA